MSSQCCERVGIAGYVAWQRPCNIQKNKLLLASDATAIGPATNWRHLVSCLFSYQRTPPVPQLLCLQHSTMAEHFLSKTWDGSICTKGGTFPVMGYTPAENLLERLKVRDSTDLLLLESEDIRHILKTVAELKDRPKHASCPKALNFHTTNENAVVTARNCLLMELVLTLDFTKTDDLLFLWCVWFNMELSVEHHSRLLAVLERLLATVATSTKSRKWKFGDKATKCTCIKTWRSWTLEKHNVEKAKHRRNMLINALNPDNRSAPPDEVVREDAEVWKDETITWAHALNDLENKDRYAKQVKEWFVNGSLYPSIWCSQSPDKTLINPTMLKPGSQKWHISPDPSPFDTFVDEAP